MKWLVLLLVPLAGCLSDGGAGADDVPPIDSPVEPDSALMAHLKALAAFPEMRFETDHGTIRMLLYTDWLPQTTAHIGGLVEDGFYDGTIIHRVVDDFVIQGGDPTQTGEGGSGPGGLSTEPVPLEIKEGLQFGSGAVGLARWTEDTGDSQWFITEKPALHLSNPQGQPNELLGPYALFGQVFEGLDVVRSIAAVETLPNDRPATDVALQTATLHEAPKTDLLQVVVDVTPNFEMWIGVGELEVPRFIVAGVPTVLRWNNDDADCQVGGWDGGANWTKMEDDVCTYELHTTFEQGAQVISGTDAIREGRVQTVTFDVLPWHDAYAPFTGTLMNDA